MMLITSSSPSGSSSTTEATITRADALPMAPGEQRLDVMHERPRRPSERRSTSTPRPRRVGQRTPPARAPGPRKRPSSVSEVAAPTRCRARTGTAGGGGLLERIDEERRLAMLGRARTAGERHADVAADVREHAPEQAMRDVVEALQSEQLLRLQQVRCRTMPSCQERDGQPPGLGERGQEQRVEPHQKAGARARRWRPRASRLSRRCRR